MASPQLFENNDVVFISPICNYYGYDERDGNPSLVWGRVASRDGGRVRWNNDRSNDYCLREKIIHARDLKTVYEPIAKSLAELLATKKVISFRYSWNSIVGGNLAYGAWYEIVSVEDKIITTPAYRDIPALSINIPNINLRRLAYTDIPGNSVVNNPRIQTIDVLQLLKSNYTLYTEEESKKVLEKIELERKKLLEERKVIIDMFSKSMVETFGEEFVDIKDVNGATEFITYFPDITIKNSEGKSHRIIDLYTKFTINPDNKFSGGLYGLRATRTHSEVNCGYIHSHLHSGNGRRSWDNFCLGDSTPIRTLITEFSSDTENYTEDNIDMFCYQLNNFVRWESLEGNPYISIRNVTNKRRVADIRNGRSLEEAYNKYTALYNDFPFEIINSTTHDSIKVITNEEFEKRITGVASEFVYKIGEEYYSNERETLSREYIDQIGYTMLTFKDKEIKYNITSGDDKEQKAQKVAHPKITEYVCNRLSEQFELFLSEEEHKDN